MACRMLPFMSDSMVNMLLNVLKSSRCVDVGILLPSVAAGGSEAVLESLRWLVGRWFWLFVLCFTRVENVLDYFRLFSDDLTLCSICVCLDVPDDDDDVVLIVVFFSSLLSRLSSAMGCGKHTHTCVCCLTY